VSHVGSGESDARESDVMSYEYATALLELPALRATPDTVCVRAWHASASATIAGAGAASAPLGFARLETLHTDRCRGVGALLRCRLCSAFATHVLPE
jgi:hypothetical protein